MSSEILGFRNQREHTIKFGKIHFLLKREFIGILMVEHWCFFLSLFAMKQQIKVLFCKNSFGIMLIGQSGELLFILTYPKKITFYSLCLNTFRELKSVAGYIFQGPDCSKRQENRNVNPRLRVEQGFYSFVWKCFSLQMLCK